MFPQMRKPLPRRMALGPVSIGIIASMFFSVTFVINEALGQTGHSWQWTAALRYFFMAPLLYGLLRLTKRPRVDKSEQTRPTRPWTWIWGGTLGFGLFYAPLTFAAQYSPAWLVAGTWQITIVIGGLLEPLLRRSSLLVSPKIPWRAALYSTIILLGVAIMQFAHFQQMGAPHVLAVIFPVLLAAIAYPTGNRLMLKILPQDMSALERTFGMTLGSLPFWLAVALWGQIQSGWPSEGQIVQSVMVAVFSGVVATVLFYQATGLAYDHPHLMAAVEATQAGEVLFSLIGSVLLLGQPWPSWLGFVGMATIIMGMILHSYNGKSK